MCTEKTCNQLISILDYSEIRGKLARGAIFLVLHVHFAFRVLCCLFLYLSSHSIRTYHRIFSRATWRNES